MAHRPTALDWVAVLNFSTRQRNKTAWKLLPGVRCRKIARECRAFQTGWGNECFFKEVKSKCVCFICNETVAAIKEYNVRWHYETKHPTYTYTSYTGAEAEHKGKQMAARLIAQQQYFFRTHKTTSYEIAQLIAQHRKHFSDGEYIKRCLTKVAGIMCPQKPQDFNNISMSRNTVAQRIEDLSENLKHQIKSALLSLSFTVISRWFRYDYFNSSWQSQHAKTNTHLLKIFHSIHILLTGNSAFHENCFVDAPWAFLCTQSFVLAFTWCC